MPAAPASAAVPDWQFDGAWDLAEVPEPSGMCYCPPRGTFFVVDDGGIGRPASIAEIDMEAAVLQQQPLGKDLEGVCFNPNAGMLYVADEAGEIVHIVDPEGLKLVGAFQLAREFEGQPLLVPGGNGIEGIEFVADPTARGGGYLLCLNQDDPRCIVQVELADITSRTSNVPVPLSAVWYLPDINAGELYYAAPAEELWVVHSWMNLVEILEIHTMQVLRWEVLPGCAQEAVACDAQGRLWIGSDTGGLARYTSKAGL